MKKMFLVSLLITGFAAFAQQLPTVAVATFDVTGGVTADEARVITELFMAELVSKGKVSVVDRVNFDKIIAEMRFQTSDWSNAQKTAALGNALNAGYVIRGQLMKMGNAIYWTATMIDIKTAQVLYSAREQVNDLSEIFGKLPGFCSQITNKIPNGNGLVGRWQSTSYVWEPERDDSREVKCILDFKENGTVIMEIDRGGQGTFYRNGAYYYKWIYAVGTGTYTFENDYLNLKVPSFSPRPQGLVNAAIETILTFSNDRRTFSMVDRGGGFESGKSGYQGEGRHTSFRKID
jgi:TolB-like protein